MNRDLLISTLVGALVGTLIVLIIVTIANANAGEALTSGRMP